MASLSRDQRNVLARTTLEARDVAEAAAAKALDTLAVGANDPHKHLNPDERELRIALRAQARQLGDSCSSIADLKHLQEKLAYDQYHRMLFARFLAENELLMSPEHSVTVSLEDCRDLARERGLGDAWQVASTFAATMLPQIFRADDPAGRVNFAPEDRIRLQQIVTGMPQEVFLADDSLGWVYQYWQAKRKDEINKSEKKIGADELAPVTQLFTEDYMVSFLLHNTLGAWWVAKRRAEGRCEELANIDFAYLRRKEDGSPAAGDFSGWPRTARELRILDPSMGSGHFLTFALPIVVAMRVEEEGLSIADAITAVLRDNLFGLELDPRCTQIAAFNLAFTTWKLGGYQTLPALSLACCGLGIHATEEQWRRLANGNEKLANGMSHLHRLFKQAPTLGSLIDPRQLPIATKAKGAASGDLLIAEYHDLRPLLEKALEKEKVKQDFDLHEIGVVAQGLAEAAEIMASEFSLVTTNVPYLGRGNQNAELKDFCEKNYPEAKADLATVFVDRCLKFCFAGGSIALVTPQNWLFLGTYKKLRERLLRSDNWDFVARLGSRAFETITGEVVNVTLLGLTRQPPASDHEFLGLDVSEEKTPVEKNVGLTREATTLVNQREQLQNPEGRIALKKADHVDILEKYADGIVGIQTADDPRYMLAFWEIDVPDSKIWQLMVAAPDNFNSDFAGLSWLLRWEEGKGALAEQFNACIRGLDSIGKPGILIHRMQELVAYRYVGGFFHQNPALIIPKNEADLAAIWCFCSSTEYNSAVRRIDQALKVTNATLVKVPFDYDGWTKVASEKYPAGLPQPYSDDATQWIFHGSPSRCGESLQVAVARLLGNRWPAERDTAIELAEEAGALVRQSESLASFADDDGIVCINPIKGEQPASERLRALLAAAFGSEWSNDKLNSLLNEAGFGGKTLEDWLRSGFFEQHCKLFHQRPFIWQIWDGRKDGFSALVNYHKLDHANLQKLIFTYLGDWIQRQKAAQDKGEEGSDARLAAALELKKKLELILEGEKPYDIFVRWKSLVGQPIGWNPDLNDGVRLNIRPFMTADVLRWKPNIKWNKDRGKDVASAPWYDKYDRKQVPDYRPGDRINDYHLTLAEKRAAREQK